MTFVRSFVFPANARKATSAVYRLAFVRGKEWVCVCRERAIFPYIFEGFSLEFEKKGNRMNGMLAFAVCRLPCNVKKVTTLFQAS